MWFLLEAVPSLDVLFEFPVIQVPKTFSWSQECESSELSDFFLTLDPKKSIQEGGEGGRAWEAVQVLTRFLGTITGQKIQLMLFQVFLPLHTKN